MKIISNSLLFLAFHFWACFSEDALDEFKACDVRYNCGEFVNITYPFWGNERQAFCGKQEFNLKCKNNRTTTIEIDSVEHNVLKINQSDQSMTIARSDLSDNICPKSQIKRAIRYSPVFRDKYDSEMLFVWHNSERLFVSHNTKMLLWYNCSAKNESLKPYKLSCGWEGENEGRANYALWMYALWNNSVDVDINLYTELGCQMNVNVTIRSMGDGTNRTAVLEEAVRQGFDVVYDEWYKIACNRCKEGGGNCGGNASYPFYCICAAGDAHPYLCLPPPSPTLRMYSSLLKKKLIIVAIPTGCIILMISIIVCVYYTWKHISNKDEIEDIIKRYSTLTPKRYSYSKLKKITDSFQNELGQGGFSTVYKGRLPDGCEVAVKLLKESKENGQDFMNEVVSITGTSHVNIVAILGFCYEPNKRALVYEYMPKGSLDKYIFNRELQNNDVKLDWNMLYSIVMGVARGLEYLHRGCNTRIVHFDIKPHNILLDNDFCPKISDFGLAKQCARESYVSMTGVKGTIGFMAPEVIFRNFGKVSHKSDVYSYGMLVLEMVGERKNPNKGVGESSEDCFPDWIYKDLVGSERAGGCRWGNNEIEEEIVRKMIIVGLCCIQTLPEERPSMSEVVALLEGSVDGLQIPPKPTLFGPPELPQPSSSSIS